MSNYKSNCCLATSVLSHLQPEDKTTIDTTIHSYKRGDLIALRDQLTKLLSGMDTSDVTVDESNSADTDQKSFLDGHYDGGNHRLSLALRVDFLGSGVISGDLFGTMYGQRDYLASFRTTPGSNVNPNDVQPWVCIFDANNEEVLTGTLRLDPGFSSDAVVLALTIEGNIDGLPKNQTFEMTAEWQSPYMRQIGIEIEQETGTQPPPAYPLNGEMITYRSAFEKAGFEVIDVGSRSNIPKEPNGWGTAQLHALMTDFAASPLTHSAWQQQLLWLGKSTREGLLGVMFDSTALLPRQGTAVFDSEIRERFASHVERKIIQTTIHEIGHGLNLAHRFEREVGRADSTSFMNYDWRYKGGGRRTEFWSRFDFSFDIDELEFLHHAPRNAVIPGGAAFHSVNYWADGNGGYSPYLPEVALDFLDLRLDPPLGGTLFAFGQPVLLQVALTNRANEPLDLDPRFLDPKAGALQVIVRRLNSGSGHDSHASDFHPIIERCFDLSPSQMDIVSPGESMTNNLNITFGSGGFTFAEPGQYEVRVVLSLFDEPNDRELVVPSNVLKIYVMHPQSQEEEEEVVSVLHREDVGVYFALGGSSVLIKAEDDLNDVIDRRQYRRKTVIDPVVANIIRCKGINLGRRYRRLKSGRFRVHEGDAAGAASLLGQLGKNSLKAFDQATADATIKLCRTHQTRADVIQNKTGSKKTKK